MRCAAEEPQLLLQKPTLNKTHIVFAYAGDLWSVPREGGDAVRLTSGTGIETDPGFLARRHARSPSPASTTATWTSSSIPAAGGVPKRLTWHPARRSASSAGRPTASASFSVRRATAYSRFAEMFTVPAEGGVEEKLPLPTRL